MSEISTLLRILTSIFILVSIMTIIIGGIYTIYYSLKQTSVPISCGPGTFYDSNTKKCIVDKQICSTDNQDLQ